MHVFAYRTHAHSLGSVISGYRWRTSVSSTSMTCPCPRYTPGDRDQEEQWQMVAKGNPNWPQAFYPMDEQMVVNPGDTLAAR